MHDVDNRTCIYKEYRDALVDQELQHQTLVPHLQTWSDVVTVTEMPPFSAGNSQLAA